MDIKRIINGGIPIPGTKPQGASETSPLDFQKLLQEAKGKNKVEGLSTASPLSKGVSEIPSDPALAVRALGILAGQAEIPQVRSQGIQAAENALSLLERYQEAIADPQMTLKKVDPLVRSLSQNVNELNSLSDQLPPSDPLRKIMSEIGIVSMVEVQKFDGGEYV